LFARWLCGLGLWWALSLTWPKQADKTVWAVLLFTVYPGFTQQWISVIYGQAFFLFATLFFFDWHNTLACPAQTGAQGGWSQGTLLALALSAFTMFSTEYFFGLELLRPALLWLVLADILRVTGKESQAAGSSSASAQENWQPGGPHTWL